MTSTHALKKVSLDQKAGMAHPKAKHWKGFSLVMCTVLGDQLLHAVTTTEHMGWCCSSWSIPGLLSWEEGG